MHWVGVDCGKRKDYATVNIFDELLVPRRTLREDIERRNMAALYTRVYAKKFMKELLGVSYPELARYIYTVTKNPQVASDYVLAIEANAAGEAVIDMLVDLWALEPVAIYTTGGSSVTERPDGGWNVPKRDLVVNMQVLYETERIKLPGGNLTPEQQDLMRRYEEQLSNFTKRITRAKNETFEAEDESTHDDLVMGDAVVLWLAERDGPTVDLSEPVAPEDTYDPRTYGLAPPG